MKIAQHLPISDKNTFEQLTTKEKQLWTTFETADIYRFWTGEEDTVPEFQYNWTTVPKLQPLDATNAPITPANRAPPAAPPAPALPPVSPPSPDSSGLPTTSSPHSSPTPSMSGTRPKQTPPPKTQSSPPDPSGASTSGTTPQPPVAKAHNLRQHSKVDYKDLNTGASQFGRVEFQKRCSRTGASVRKSVAKVRKMSLAKLFPPISQNSSSSSMASSKWPRDVTLWNRNQRRTKKSYGQFTHLDQTTHNVSTSLPDTDSLSKFTQRFHTSTWSWTPN